MATNLKCQALFPEGGATMTLSAPDTVALTVEQTNLACRLDMTQPHTRISRLGAWLVEYRHDGTQGRILFTAMAANAPVMQVRFFKGRANVTLHCDGASHQLDTIGLDVSVDSISVLQKTTPVRRPLEPPIPGSNPVIAKLQKQIDELEKLAALNMDKLLDELKQKNDKLYQLNTATAQEIERAEDELEQAERLQAAQKDELAAAQNDLAKARQELAKAQDTCKAVRNEAAQARTDTSALEAQIETLQQQALLRCRMTQDLSEADVAALQETLKEQRQQYFAMSEATALINSDPVISCKSVSDLLGESQSRLEDAQKRIAAIITLREKINDDVMSAVTGRGQISANAEAGEA